MSDSTLADRCPSIATIEAALHRVSSPLPGALPMENRRPINIRAAQDQLRLAAALGEMFPQITLAEWERRCDEGRIIDQAGRIRSGNHIVRAGESLLQVFPEETEPPVSTDIRVLYLDESLLLVHKPAPLPMHACGRFHRNTLQHLLNLACHPISPKPLHRLDANTSGLVLFALNRITCRELQTGFLEGSVEKIYLVRVDGHPDDDEFSSNAKISATPGTAGIRETDDSSGRVARTDFRVMRRDADGTSLLEARLLTGRTNQIRAHLWAMHLPVVGDPAYRPGRKIGSRQTLALEDPPLQLHAWKLAFRDPCTQEIMRFQTALPDWAKERS